MNNFPKPNENLDESSGFANTNPQNNFTIRTARTLENQSGIPALIVEDKTGEVSFPHGIKAKSLESETIEDLKNKIKNLEDIIENKSLQMKQINPLKLSSYNGRVQIRGNVFPNNLSEFGDAVFEKCTFDISIISIENKSIFHKIIKLTPNSKFDLKSSAIKPSPAGENRLSYMLSLDCEDGLGIEKIFHSSIDIEHFEINRRSLVILNESPDTRISMSMGFNFSNNPRMLGGIKIEIFGKYSVSEQ